MVVFIGNRKHVQTGFSVGLKDEFPTNILDLKVSAQNSMFFVKFAIDPLFLLELNNPIL